MKIPKFLLLTALLLAGTLQAGAFEVTTTLPAPRGDTPVIDGVRAEGEWDDALRVELLGGGAMFLKHDDEFLYLLVTGKKKGLASICVERREGIAILHASAALGTADYQGRFDDAALKRSFFFELRDTGRSLEAKKARKTFLKRELWFANTSREGSLIREFQISLDIAAEHGRIPMAVTWFTSDDATLAYWPEDLSDDCLNLELIKGNTPETLDFQPHRWPVVTVKTLGMPPGNE
jgi:hypothetical protein